MRHQAQFENYFFLLQVLLYSLGIPGTCCVDQHGLKLAAILVPGPLKFWERYMPR